jgi:tetratricopeptide (TPR) repeat protein
MAMTILTDVSMVTTRTEPIADDPAARWTRRDLMIAAGLVALSIVAFWPALGSGYIWDDDRYITENPLLRSVHGLLRIWAEPDASPDYYPLTFTFLWIGWHVWGKSALGYHLANVLMHAFGAVMLWRLLRRLAVPGSLIAAAVFLVHPVQVETVAWVTEIKNILSTLLAITAVGRFAETGLLDSDGTAGAIRLQSLIASAVLYLLAVLAKGVAVVLPAVLLILIWWKRGTLRRRDGLAMIPYAVVGLPLAMVSLWHQHHHVGATGSQFSFTVTQRVVLSGRTFWFYLAKLVWPWGLSFIYPRWDLDVGRWWQIGFLIAEVALMASLWLVRRRIGRGPLATMAIFAVALFPASGVFNVYWQVYAFVADHVQYAAMIAPVALAAACLSRCNGESREGPALRSTSEPALLANVRCLFACLLIPILAVSTCWRCRVYHDPISLWADTVNRNPNSWMAHLNLGVAMRSPGHPEMGLPEIEKARDLAPNLVDTRWTLGQAYAACGRFDDAIAEYQVCIAIDPTFPQSYYGMGQAMETRGDLTAATAWYRKSLDIAPSPEPHVALGLIAIRQRRNADAESEFAAAIALKPDHARAHDLLAGLLMKRNAYAEAIPHYLAILDVDPDQYAVHTNLGLALLQTGHRDEAANHFRTALELKPGFQPAQLGLAAASPH